jgi:hypothetical protein
MGVAAVKLYKSTVVNVPGPASIGMASGTIAFSNRSFANFKSASVSSFTSSNLVADPCIIDKAVISSRNPPANLNTSISMLKKLKMYFPRIKNTSKIL